MEAVIEKAVNVHQEGDSHELRDKAVEGASARKLLHQVGKLSLNLLGGNGVCVEPVGLVALGIVKTICQIFVGLAQLFVVILIQPEYKPAVGFIIGMELGIMGGIRRNQQTVPVFQLIAFITDVVCNIAFQEKIELVVVMFMGIYGFKRSVIVIEESLRTACIAVC